MPQSEFEIIHRTPSVQDYMRLRSQTGLSDFSEAAAKMGLKGTVHSVVVLYKEQVIGMGRIIGDGGCFFQIVDIAVDPSHQGKGLGKTIMKTLMAFIDKELPSSAYISLIADVPANKLYEKFGFLETAPRSIGMAYRVK
ncbi:MAG: GNAT family N-acetyltransferase [Cohaesibacter sp.]|nr:GNAT family N-acetyltransferase [Cohaesibacter sp.]